MNEFDESFFRLGTGLGQHGNLVYWPFFYNRCLAERSLSASEYKLPMVIQYRREAQMSSLSRSVVGDVDFIARNGMELFCPVQVCGTWCPVSFFVGLLGMPIVVDRNVDREPLLLLIWDVFSSSNVPNVRYGECSGWALKRAKLIVDHAKSRESSFGLFFKPGWTSGSVDRNIPREGQQFMKENGFIFTDRG